MGSATPSTAQYRPVSSDGAHPPFAIQVIETDGDRIVALDVFADPALFDLPASPAGPGRGR